MRDLYKYVLVGVVCLLIGAAGTALAMHTGGGEVRVVVQRHDDGRVEVGLQEREVGGGWGERQLPAARFLSESAASGQWIASSPVDVGAGHYLDGALVCVIGHGLPGDVFWRLVDQGVETASEDLSMNVRFATGATPDAQAALVRECVNDEAVAIATTLAAPETMAPALAEARASRTRMVTFNSGSEHAAANGSALHIGLDDRQGGVISGETFTANNLSGAVLCVIHEAENVGLEARCDGLEAAYAGEVERLRIADTGVSDLEGSQAAIEQRISEGGVGGILTLNSSLLPTALAARGDAQIAVASFGWSPDSIPLILSRQVLFVIYDQPHVQAYLTAASIGMMGFSGQFGDVSLLYGGAQVLIEPILFDYERAMATAEQIQRQIDQLSAAGDESSGPAGE